MKWWKTSDIFTSYQYSGEIVYEICASVEDIDWGRQWWDISGLKWMSRPTSLSDTLKQPVHCCVSPLRQQQTVMTCAVSNDVEEQNFITLAAALTANRYPSRSVWPFFSVPKLSFFSRGERPSLPLAGCQLSTMIPWSSNPSQLGLPRSSLLFFFSFLSLCSSHRHRRMYLLWYLCQWPLPEYPWPV